MFLTWRAPRNVKLALELVLDLLVHRPGNENPARLGQRLQGHRDIDAVAEQRAVLLDHVAEIYPDTQPHALVGGQGVVLLGDRVLEGSARSAPH